MNGGSKVLLSIMLFVSISSFAATYRDRSGRIAGTAREQGNRTVFRDAQGRITGSALKLGNQIIYRDGTGRIRGTAVSQGNNRTLYRDGSGRIRGSADQTFSDPCKDPYGMRKGVQKNNKRR